MADCVYLSRDMVRVNAGGTGCCGNSVDVRRCLSQDQSSEYCIPDRDFDGLLHGLGDVGGEQKQIGAVSCQRCAARKVSVALMPISEDTPLTLSHESLAFKLWENIHYMGRHKASDSAIVIDCDRHGHGDAVITAWVAAGEHKVPVLLYGSGGKRELLELLDCKVLPVRPDVAHNIAITDAYGTGVKSVGSFCMTLGIEPSWKRPNVMVNHSAMAGVEKLLNGRKTVTVAAYCHHPTRMWELSKWRQVIKALQDRGYLVACVGGAVDVDGVIDVPYGWHNMAACMSLSEAAVCLDSGPMHVAGTVGISTLAIMGPSTHHVASHMQTVRCVTPDVRGVPCAGCWWKAPYYSADRCHPCIGMGSISVDDVLVAFDDMMADDVFAGLVDVGGISIRKAMAQQDMVLVKEVLGDDCYRVRQVMRGAKTVVDIGAHIGCFAVAAHRVNVEAKIICVEANRRNIPALQANVGAFATVINGAASSIGGRALVLGSVYVGTGNTGISTTASCEVTTPPRGYRLEGEVVRVSLKEMIDMCGGRIDVLKIDCEGCEYDVLDCDDVTNVGLIVGEYHGGELWHKLIQSRFSGWSVTILRDSGEDWGRADFILEQSHT